MSIEKNLANNDLKTSVKDMKNPLQKFGLCPFSTECWLYALGEYHCNVNRGVFLKNGMTQPGCYQKRKDE